MKTSSAFIALLLLFTFSASFATGQADITTGTRKVVSQVSPAYPNIARNINLSGSVRLEVVVTPGGTAKSLRLLGGNPVFADAAEKAVREWKWEKRDHETIETVQVRFNQ